MPIDPKLDPALMKAGAELDAMVAEWMGWEQSSSNQDCWIEVGTPPDFIHRHFYIHYGGGEPKLNGDAVLWSPSTNPAHAGEARRKAISSEVIHNTSIPDACHVVIVDATGGCHFGECSYAETDGDKGLAEALAICRAIAGLKPEGE